MEPENPFSAPYQSDAPSEFSNPYASPLAIDAKAAPQVALSAEWNGTRRGIKIVYSGILMIVICCLLMIFSYIGMVLMNGGPAGRGIDPTVLMVASALLAAGVVIAAITIFVGECFCTTVPRESGAKGLANANVMLKVFNFTISMTVLAVVSLNPPEEVAAIAAFVNLANAILGLAAFFCFLNFLKRVARHIGEHHLASNAQSIIGIFIGIVVGYAVMLVIIFLTAFAAPGGRPGGGAEMGLPMLIGCGGIVILIAFIAAICMYTTLLRSLSNAIFRHQFSKK